ncbi:MAG: hypothetical protein V3R89_08235 [Thermoanaerobaculia bacterium]
MCQRVDRLHSGGGALKRTVVTVGLALWGAMLATPQAAAEGRSFRLEGLRSDELRPAELLQGAVIVIVWASWSPRCRDIVERSNAIVDRWGDRARVLTVVFQEDRETVERFLAGQRPRAPVYLDRDGAFSKKHAVTHLPGLLIFKDGVTGFSGRLPNNPHSLIEQTLG